MIYSYAAGEETEALRHEVTLPCSLNLNQVLGLCCLLGLSCLGHDQDLAGARGGLGLQESVPGVSLWEQLLQEEADADSNEELCVAQGLAHRGQRPMSLSAGKGAFPAFSGPSILCSQCSRVTRQCLSACSILGSGQCKRHRSLPSVTFHFKVGGGSGGGVAADCGQAEDALWEAPL